MPAFDFGLVRTTRFLDVVFLDPDPSEPFRELVRTLGAGAPPYDTGVTDILPHVTVARSADPADLDRIEMEVSEALPLACRAFEAWLVVQDGDRPWRLHTRFPLGAA